MEERFLFVDDDTNILAAYRRSLRKQCQLDTAEGGAQGLESIREKGPYAVIVSDMQMPEMNGVEFLSRVREIAPESVRIMLTGNADQRTAVDAVNQGRIYRFVNKPCPPEVFSEVLNSGLQQYRLLRAEKDLLDKTLKGAVGVLTEVLGLISPGTFSRAERIQRFVSHVAAQLELESTWQFEIASMLSLIGCVSVPSNTLESIYKGLPMTQKEETLFRAHPKVGGELLSNIPRLEKVAEMVARQFDPSTNLEGSGVEADISMGARMIHAASEYDALVLANQTHLGAIARLRERKGEFDERVLGALATLKDGRDEYEPRQVQVTDLNVFMIVDSEVRAKNGALLVAKGQQITNSLLQRLRNFQSGVGIVEPLHVLVPHTSDESAPARA